MVDGQRRSSLIIDPPDGRVPALTAEARARTQARPSRTMGRGQYDHPEYRPLAERCLLSFGPTTPLVPNYFYNNNLQIVQTPDHVMIMMEMVHDARIVRIGGTHLPKHIRPWMGDSIGHWEGDTLVVETTNFPPQQNFRGSSENLHVVERFRRVDAKTINYRFTVTDPTTFTAPFTGEIPFQAMDELIYEYACHEGNYAMANVLSGARNEEKATRNEAIIERTYDQTKPVHRVVARSPGSSLAGRSVIAHHAFGAEFDPNAPIRLQGKVVRLEWVNPHTWIHIETVKDGKPEVWMIEGGTPNTLLRRGITRDTVAIGTEVVVDGYQTKDHSLKRANGRDVTFADGRKLFMGSSGTGAPKDGRDPTESAEEAGRQVGRGLGEADPAARGGHHHPQRNRQRADQHLAARCVTYRRPR